MSDTNLDILNQAAGEARRLVAELEPRRREFESSRSANNSLAQLQDVQKMLDAALATAGKTLAAVQCELERGDHPPDSVRSS